MIKRGDFFALIIVTILFNYAIAIGTTFNGILSAEFHSPTLIMTGLMVAVWLAIHWQRGWVWHRTPLDWVMLLWIAAFVLSLVANLEVWRRIAIGIWYVTAYIGVWYMLHDLIANEGISRDTLVDGLLICGVVVLIFGFVQSRDWFTVSLPLMLSDKIPFGLPRPVSTLGNPNALANFLVVILPFAFARTFSARLIVGRIVMGIYSLLTLLLLFLTYSRGAWIGIAAGTVVWCVMFLAERNLLSPKSLVAWWRQRTMIARTLTFAGILSGIVVMLIVLLIFRSSLNAAGRGTDLRTYIYDTAIMMFNEKPLTGHGLFTFGRGLVRLQSIPPTTPHSHAHNAPLHIAAELGIVGMVALFATLVVTVKSAWQNWRDMTNRQRSILSAAVGAVVAFAVHQLTDIPAMTPAIVLAGLVALALMLIPIKPIPLASNFLSRVYPFMMAGVWIILLISGFWSSQIYSEYMKAHYYAIDTGDFRGAAARLQPVIDADPNLSLNYMEQGLLLGLAANEGDQQAAFDGISTYQKFLALDPYYAIVWANMAALQWQVGERDTAFESMQRAVQLAPESWQFAVGLGLYADALSNTEIAQNAYQQALTEFPDSVLLPELEAFRRDDLILTVPAQVILLLTEGSTDEAMKLWSDNPQAGTSSKYVIDALLALAENNRAAAESALVDAENVASNEGDRAWVHIGKAQLAQFDGDADLADDQIAIARQQLVRAPFAGDFIFGINVALAQFLQNGFPRIFIPQVYYPVDDPVLLYLIENT